MENKEMDVDCGEVPQPQSQLQRQLVMDTPTDPVLPQTNEYSLPQFYVRKCYKQYYDQVFGLLQTHKLISITGTKGIGKSMFYQYTFKRVKEEHPTLVVITASFAKGTRDFNGGIVFFPDGTMKRLITFDSLVECEFHMIDSNIPVISLYDGAPKVVAKCRMICFTSYDAAWFLAAKDMKKIHATLYMPTWFLGELKEARDALHLEFSDQQLEDNFAQFGGVPRVCFLDLNLENDQVEYNEYKETLDQGIHKIQSFNHFVEMLNKVKDPEQIPHRLFRFVPRSDLSNRMAYFEPISTAVSSAVSEHLKARNHTERVEMLLKLEGVAKASSFYRFLFEPHVHEILMRDRHFQIRSLEVEGVSVREFVITPESQIEYVEKKSYAEYAVQFLQIPLASNHRSCDSWFVDKLRRLVVFVQVTSSYHHPESQKGLENVLLKLSSSDSDILNYEKILLFVVPDTLNEIMSTKFTKQIIEDSQAPSLLDSKKDVLFKDIYGNRNSGTLVGFGEKSYKEVLEVVGIDEDQVTLQDVHVKLSIFSTKVRNLLYSFFTSISEAPCGIELKQYVLGIPVKA
jgi:hypothetical protein